MYIYLSDVGLYWLKLFETSVTQGSYLRTTIDLLNSIVHVISRYCINLSVLSKSICNIKQAFIYICYFFLYKKVI